jgi:hypothetical protein
MAKISSYSVVNNPVLGSDMLIGTDVNDNDATKNFTVSQLASFIAGAGAFVPYTGATANVDLGANTLIVDNGNFAGGIQVNNLQLTGNFTAPNSKIYLNFNPGTTGQVLTSQGSGGGVIWANVSLGYKIYVATISQSSTSAPIENNVFNNTFTNPFTWNYSAVGRYTITNLTFDFTTNKTIVFINPGYLSDCFTVGWEYNSDTQLTIHVRDKSGNYADGLLFSASIEIRVYA